MYYIRKSLIYSMRKAFLEREVVELVYKFNEKSTRVFNKVSRPLKYHSNCFGGHVHINI